MLPVTRSDPSSILSAREGPVAELVNPDGAARICLVCEHASAFIPSSLDALGLAQADRFSHAVWDIGAGPLARGLADTLDAPLVVSGVSRLVYDCNRPPSAPDAIPARAERIRIPGNETITEAERDRRANEIYQPFRNLLSQTLAGFAAPPTLVTIHSFTPVWHGKRRVVELGLLHDADARLANAIHARRHPELATRLNEPYSAADGVTHTLAEHGVPRGLANVMIEVRNDLLADDAGIARMTRILSAMITEALTSETGEAA